MERGAVMIVNQWPTHINIDGGILCNPTPEQCRQAGYELYVQPTAEEIAEQERLIREQMEAHTAEVEALRTDYRNAVAQFCTVAGLPIVAKFEDTTAMRMAIENANAGKNVEQILGLTQLALTLQNLITELRRKDGDDAWSRI
jgi:hypothetical protein